MNILLLPPPPSDSSLSAYRTAYGPALAKVFSQIATNVRSKPLPLDNAILLDNYNFIGIHPRSSIYTSTEKILGILYTLICGIFAENLQEAVDQKVDFRIFLAYKQVDAEDHRNPAPQGPLVALKSLALANRPWTDIFGVDGENGEKLLQNFVSHRRSLPLSKHANLFNVHRIVGGTSMKMDTEKSHSTPDAAGRRHLSIAVGGTFDHLHTGHKLLLTATAIVLEPGHELAEAQERSLTIGITVDELLRNKKYAEVLESWETRQRSVILFLSALLDLDTSLEDIPYERFARAGPNGNAVHYKFGANLTVKCVEISDPFGPTITEQNISALVVSGETRAGGQAVNEKRAEKGWEPLEVFEIDVLDSSSKDDISIAEQEDFQSKISSTAIRKRLTEQK